MNRLDLLSDLRIDERPETWLLLRLLHPAQIFSVHVRRLEPHQLLPGDWIWLQAVLILGEVLVLKLILVDMDDRLDKVLVDLRVEFVPVQIEVHQCERRVEAVILLELKVLRLVAEGLRLVDLHTQLLLVDLDAGHVPH